VGARVEAAFTSGGKLERGTVVSVSGAAMVVCFDDGFSRSLSRGDLHVLGSDAETSGFPHAPGAHVQAYFRGVTAGKAYPGVIVRGRRSAEGVVTYVVYFEDGDVDTGVQEQHVFVNGAPQPVSAAKAAVGPQYSKGQRVEFRRVRDDSVRVGTVRSVGRVRSD
jgi:hypothetical protein